MKKVDLWKAAHLTSSTVAKLRKGENVITAVLVSICEALNCNVEDIMDIVPKE